MQASLLGDMEGAGSLSEALEGGAAFGALQGLMQTWLHAAVMDQNWCASDSAVSGRAATLTHACRILQHQCSPARNADHQGEHGGSIRTRVLWVSSLRCS